MKGTYHDVMTVDEFYQALFQDKGFFAEHGITHVRSAALYFTPCDERGRTLTVTDGHGNLIDGYESAGCYHSAADSYERGGDLEPKAMTRTTKTGGKRSGRSARRCKPG